jgi:hypothetical protein
MTTPREVSKGHEIVGDWIEDEMRRSREVHVSYAMRDRLAYAINLALSSAGNAGYCAGVEDAATIAADEHTGLIAPPALTRLVANIRKLITEGRR